MKQKVEDWLTSYSNSVFDLFRTQHTAKMRRVRADMFGFFNPDLRLFSEMPLCEVVIELSQKCLTNFHLVNYGFVEHSFFGKQRIGAHNFFEHDGYVICITPGQFLMNSVSSLYVSAGSRIKVIKESLPCQNWVHLIEPNNLFALCAPLALIEERLGIKYIF